MIDIYKNLVECKYSPEADFPERTDPQFEAKREQFEAEEAVCVEQFKVDLFAYFGVDPNNNKIKQAFEIAYERERNLGLYAVADLFEELLPLVVESN